MLLAQRAWHDAAVLASCVAIGVGDVETAPLIPHKPAVVQVGVKVGSVDVVGEGVAFEAAGVEDSWKSTIR